MSIRVGTTVVLHTEFKVLDQSSAASIKAGKRVLADPSSVACTITSPSGVVTNYSYPATITRVSLAFYTCPFTPSEAGDWYAAWTGTGAASVVGEPQRISVKA
ncbi:MAG: hypothetical protein HOW73_11765 [Polyangiaceae bacterium]|nr:hypothetical protein [Polyangiaceae bacterium]